ncbi:Putative nuclear fusion protein Kar5 [Colletotrichum destructivum]|uniref:Nuclear fusion protein Kar5 n=1 Tax=Colletotrichum destructivum TaxID=34406 RepID=A0AAX4ISN4_9PEZI|nr:Putative nuclear fusion protein Kar5 [Colletotrichum destructivum]
MRAGRFFLKTASTLSPVTAVNLIRLRKSHPSTHFIIPNLCRQSRTQTPQRMRIPSSSTIHRHVTPPPSTLRLTACFLLHLQLRLDACINMDHRTSKFLWGVLWVIFCVSGVDTFSWGSNGDRSNFPRSLVERIVNPTVAARDKSRLPTVFDVAMQELQDLESEPLCHRIAARLLVNNCQLLDGKDDATVLIDSGRKIRDFVDSYAASLAICDLERGSFVIPSGCTPFREYSLVSLPDSTIPRLHVSPQQIDSCLSGLAKSDSAWNTWVSYRHKALRFCEAARADNDKAQSIRLHQRLTEVLFKLSEGVERELEARFDTINARATETTERLEKMIPDIDRLRNTLQDLDHTISQNVMQMAHASNSAMRSGLEDAQTLQQLLSVLLKTLLSNNAEVAASQKVALKNFKDHAELEVAVVMSALATAAASSVSLQSQMELSTLRLTELAGRQDHLEKANVTEDLSSKYESHTDNLDLAQRLSGSLLETLDDLVISTSDVRGSLSHRSSWTSWLPYLMCPAASLLMGSYGLPPSAVRNFGLIVLGELAGLVVSYVRDHSPSVLDIPRSGIPLHCDANVTLASTLAEARRSRDLPMNLRKSRWLK